MSAEGVRVHPVEGSHDEREFQALPYRLYRDDPLWVAPLRSEEATRWDPRRNPTLRGRRVARFLARSRGRTVGRVAAILDGDFAERWAPGSGFVGFFECERDPDAASLLLHAAEGWLASHGVRTVLGPVHLSFHHEVGFLVEGDASSAMILSPYNPPHYPERFAACGYSPRSTYHAYLWSPSCRHTEAVARILRRAERASEARIRRVDLSRIEDEYRTIFDLYNASFRDVFGFVPIGWEEFHHLAESFRPFLRPELIFIAEVEGSPVGFSLTLPNVNEALHGLNGRLFPFGWLRILRRVPRVRTARYMLLGVAPEWIARGLAARLAQATVEASLRCGFERVELSLVHGENRRIRHVIEAFGCPPIKTYVLYQKEIG